MFLFHRIFIFAFIFVLAAGVAYPFLNDPGFLKGVTSKSDLSVHVLNDVGANSVCLFFRWNEVEPEISNYLTIGDIEGNPKLIDNFTLSRDWKVFDERIQPFVDAEINIFLTVACGFDSQLPLFGGEPANPDRLGRENYLGHIFLFASAVARRYKDKVRGFVLEDELNEAALTALFGWRSPSPLMTKSSWSDFHFLTELMECLSTAVRSEAPNALAIVNFHTDIHPNFHSIPLLDYIVGNKSWIEAALAWQDYADVIALDAYPNYYVADPVYGGDIGDKVAEVKSLLPDKPVIVLGTAYSVPRQGENPSPIDWTESKQDDYVDAAIKSSLRSGADGFFYFDLAGQGCIPPPGGYTERDISALEKFGSPFRNGDITAILIMIFQFGPDYLRGRFVQVISAAEGFGFMKPDGSRRQAYYTVKWWYRRAIPKLERRDYLISIASPLVKGFEYQNYPNPFNPDTWIPYRLREDAHVMIRIYTASGQLVRTLDPGYKPAGFYTDRLNAAYWDGSNDAGEHVGSGVYFYSIKAGKFATTSKMIILE